MKKIIWLGVILISILATSGCSLYGNSQTSTPRAMPAITQPVTAQPATLNNNSGAINIENFAFSPRSMAVKKGATITWTNNDSAPHGIKSTGFNSETLNKGQSFSFTFNEAGTFNYSCSIHPAMTGEIIVE